MSEASTRDLIARYFAALNAGDHEAVLACLSDDVAHDISQGAREIGKEKFRWFLARQARHFRQTATDIAIMTAPGGVRAAAEFTVRGTYLATLDGFPEARGQHYRLPAGIFFEIDEELISRLSACFNHAALRVQLQEAGPS